MIFLPGIACEGLEGVAAGRIRAGARPDRPRIALHGDSRLEHLAGLSPHGVSMYLWAAGQLQPSRFAATQR